MVEVGGTWDERFTGVRDALAANLKSGLDVGASVAVVLDGEPVVDIWGGYIDKQGGWGGSIVAVDLDARMSVAHLMNRMGEGTLGDERGAGYVGAAFAALAEG